MPEVEAIQVDSNWGPRLKVLSDLIHALLIATVERFDIQL